MSDPQDYLRIDVARTPFEAKVVAGVLREAGIPTMVNDTPLTDEVAITQLSMNMVNAKVSVPKNRIEDAYRALATARSTAGERLSSEMPGHDTEPAVASDFRIRTPTLVMGFLALVFLFMWMATQAKLGAVSPEDPLRDFEWTGKGSYSNWKQTGKLAIEWRDDDRNGVAESWSNYNHAGSLLSTAIDADENGLPERIEVFRDGGVLAGSFHDRDADGVFEEWIQLYPDKSRAKWTDADGDGGYEVREFFDASGKSLYIEDDCGHGGMVRR